MGFFEFKNVAQPKEVFAVANKELVVPDPDSLTGKTKIKGARKEANRNFGDVIQDLWNRKVFLAAGVYLIGLWVLLTGANFIVSNYGISPYWPDIVLVFFISFLPSVILHSYYHNKLEINRMRLVEKITIPSNALLSVALLFFLFWGKDLGATTQTLVSTDEFGNRIEREIIKSQFQKKLNFYPFVNETADSTLDWLSYGIARMLVQDLMQDNYCWPNDSWGQKTLGAMLTHAASQNIPYFITGRFGKKDSLYIITTQLYDSKNGRLIQETTSENVNFFELGDELSLQIKKDIGLPAYHIQNQKDLPVSSILTNNLEAYRYYIQATLSSGGTEKLSYYIKADQLDPSFALSNYDFAFGMHTYSISQQASINIIDKAMKHRANVNDMINMRIRTLYYNIYNQPEKAIALMEMQADLYPEDLNTYNRLMQESIKNGYYEKALAACRKLYELSPELTHLKRIQARLLDLLNRSKEALEVMNSYVKRFPKDERGFLHLGDIHLTLGNLDEAENIFNKISLMNPENQSMPLMLEHIQYIREQKDDFLAEKFGQLLGEYRYSDTEMIINFTLFEKKLMSQVKNQSIFQLYPINDSTVISSSGIVIILRKNKAGKVYQFISIHGGDMYISYSLDSSIKKAKKLLDEGKDEAALEAYESAYIQNPDHHFLQNFIQHLKFKLRNKEIPPATLWKKLLGNYHGSKKGEEEVTLELNNDVVDWGVPDGLRSQLLPINDKEFVLSEQWGTKVLFHEEAGKHIRMEWIFENGTHESFVKVD